MSSWKTKGVAATGAALALLFAPLAPAQAYDPDGGILYEVGEQDCLKGLGNCAVYPKSAQLPSGRIVAAFERSTVVTYADGTTGAVGQTMPIYKSDDDGDTWQPLTEVQAPAFLSDDPQYDPYTSNWTNPYLYVLPEDVGDLAAGTLLLASVVSGEDEYYREQKAADATWVPDNDGDRRDVSIALFSSADDGASWGLVDMIAAGGWQGGSAGASFSHVAEANEYGQVDPLWEPHLMVHDGQLVAYYSDENEYLGYDAATGIPAIDPDNDTAIDGGGQILVHRTWDGTSGSAWSEPVVDVAGQTFSTRWAWDDDAEQWVELDLGKDLIGGGRPGMTTVVPTTDGKWLMTFEYWGDPWWMANNRYKISDSPVDYFSDGDVDGIPVGDIDDAQTVGLPFDEYSQGLSWGGSPVLVALPDGRLLYNASGSGDVWMNESGASDGVWTQLNTTLDGGYSRNLQYVEGTGRVVILQGTWGGPDVGAVIRYGDVDLGHSVGDYYTVVNRATGQVLGTDGNIADAQASWNVPRHDDVQLEDAGAFRADTQAWHVVDEGEGTMELLNQSGGRSVSTWGAPGFDGQEIVQWVDEADGGRWDLEATEDGYLRFRAHGFDDLYLAGGADGDVALRASADDGTQDWSLIPVGEVHGPTFTVKDGAQWTVGEDGVYRKVSYTVHAPSFWLASVTVNGIEQDGVVGASFDLDKLTPDFPGVVRGVNVVEATDVLGNTTTIEFTIGKKQK
ncbi:RICIN domain-containing protein [Microbacter sp. GSS18]|nr:RICIN domain-containing protein [Microbacter sp. GSS18]